ncbi:MAG: exodeoxyribonuclease VII small subunit [Clostridia bacterium]|nr:exodeoxyribonuclease VII small subunit [Clostridia bacterium]
MENAPKSFEEAMKRLEEIAGLLEDGEAELAQSLALYKEGAGLAAWCTEQLANARQEVAVHAAQSTAGLQSE